MAIYEEMRRKKNGVVVRVYSIQDNMAYIFDPDLYQKRNNNGWEKVKLSHLVPMDFPIDNKNYVSKTKKNKAKERMKLLDATWATSDHILWSHAQIEEAIAHELELMDKENNIENTEEDKEKTE